MTVTKFEELEKAYNYDVSQNKINSIIEGESNYTESSEILRGQSPIEKIQLNL